MTAKRNRKVLPIEDKIKIISRLDNGESVTSLSKNYNVGKATISDIKSKKNEILKFASKLKVLGVIKKRKTNKKPSDEALDNAVYSWFKKMKNVGKFVNGHLLRCKALELNKKLGGSSEFKASTGWLANFKDRHGIKLRWAEGLADSEVWSNKVSRSSKRSKRPKHRKAIMGSTKKIMETDLNKNLCNNESLGYCPTHAAAFIALETAMAWSEQQFVFNHKDLLVLKKMKDLAAQKLHFALTQRKDEVCFLILGSLDDRRESKYLKLGI